jgi:hypothetical protein
MRLRVKPAMTLPTLCPMPCALCYFPSTYKPYKLFKLSKLFKLFKLFKLN